MGIPLRVLIVEDSEDDALLVVRELKQGGYDPAWERVDTPEAMTAALEKGRWALVISDYSMPRFDALAALMLLRETGLDLPFLVVSGTIGEAVAVEAMKAGVHDYFMKNNLARLAPAVKRELREAEGRWARRQAEEKVRASAAHWQATFDAINDAVCLLDAEQSILACNKAMASLVGKPTDQIVGRKCWEVVHGSDQPLEGCPVGRMRETLQREHLLLPVGDKWLEVTVDPMLDEQGRLTGTVHIISDTTEQRQSEAALKQSEEKWRSLTEDSPDQIMLLDPDGKILFVNRTVPDLTREEVIGSTVFDFVPPEFHEVASDCSKHVLETGKPDSYRTEYRTKDGKARFFDVRVGPVFQSGKVVGLVSSSTDITERKRAEEDLRKKTHELGERVKELRCLYAVSDLLQEGGTSLDAVLQAVVDVIPPGWQFPQVTCARIQFGDKEYSTENFTETARILSSDIYAGKERLGRLEVCYPEENPPAHEAPFSREERSLLDAIAEQLGRAIEARRAEEGLRESEERFRSIFDNATDGILLADARTKRFRTGNAAVCRMLGYDIDEISALGVEDIHPADKLSYVVDQFQKQIRGEIALAKDIPVKRKDGSVFNADVNSSPVAFGERTYLLGIFRDISERKKAEEALRAVQEQLVQAQKMEAVGRLAGGVAHDFNNLLAAVIGFSELGMDKLKQEDPLYKDLAEIRDVGERAAVLVRQLLAFSRKQMLESRVLDLNSVVKDMDSILRRVIGEDIDVATVLRPKVRRVKVDPGQFEQVIMNLAVNARDAMPEGGKLTIETGNVDLDEEYVKNHVGSRPGPHVMLAVTDSGCGMDYETRSRVFEPFYTTKEAGRGTGLGLSTVYGIVKQSGGSVYVYSEPGEGTTFKIYLPVVEGPLTREVAAVVAGPLRGTETVLVVEDEEVVRRLVCRILRSRGYRVLEAANGGEALLICEKHERPIPLLLSDVVLPGMSGRKTAERLAEVRPEMRVLFMSGYTDNAVVHHGVLDETTPFIQKPFTPDGLALKVREVLDAPGKGPGEGSR